MTAREAKRWSNVVFAGLFALAVLLLARILLPFLMPVLLGGFLVVLFLPVQEVLHRALKQRRSLCAALSTLIVFVLILLPLAGVGWLVGGEVLGLLEQGQAALERVDPRQVLLDSLPRGVGRHLRAEVAGAELEQALLSVLGRGASMLTELVGVGTGLVVDLFLMVVAMYYFFLDGRRLLGEVERLVPLEQRYLRAFMQEFHDVAHALVYGNTVTALVQGALGLVGLLLVGVPGAWVWGALMVLMALVPVGGTALVWGPLGVVLLLTGKAGQGVFLLVWGTLLVGSTDNLLRPRLYGARMALHPLLVFLSMFGGLAVFGVMGLLVGPLVASLFMAMVRIWRRDFLEPQAAPTEPSGAPGLPLRGG